jgi:hypothetical protein
MKLDILNGNTKKVLPYTSSGGSHHYLHPSIFFSKFYRFLNIFKTGLYEARAPNRRTRKTGSTLFRQDIWGNFH